MLFVLLHRHWNNNKLIGVSQLRIAPCQAEYRKRVLAAAIAKNSRDTPPPLSSPLFPCRKLECTGDTCYKVSYYIRLSTFDSTVKSTLC